MRIEQGAGARGSLKWIQVAVNDHPGVIDAAIRSALSWDSEVPITWVSPLREDNFAEYRDQAFLDRLAVVPHRCHLNQFWPPRGPQWDALGRTGSRQLILIEAKAHLQELASPGSAASENSLKLIRSSLAECKAYLGVDSGFDWAGQYYQYCNRLAHLYWLRVLNDLPAFLVFVYFLNATEVSGPRSIPEWEGAIQTMYSALGLRAKHVLSAYVGSIFIDVRTFTAPS